MTETKNRFELERHTLSIEARDIVYANPERDLHGPSVVRAGNGDLILHHQDSAQHLGGDGFVHQWRSTDMGLSWQDEGPVFDWRGKDEDALFAECGLAPDGSLVAFIQRRKSLSDDDGILGSCYAKSYDNAHSWQLLGPVSADEDAFLSPRNVISLGRAMYVTGWSPQGHGLFVSMDNGQHWTRQNIIFPTDHPEFPQLRHKGPPFYPHVELCPDGSLLAMTYHTPEPNTCFSRRSYDLGLSWGPITREKNLPLWAPRLRHLENGLMLVTGRDYLKHASVGCLTMDSGHHWSEPFILDRPAYRGSYAYTDSITLGDNRILLFTSSPQSPGRGDIVVIRLLLEDC
ncbi:MAG: exo-alpha-sialidase [Gammaproteobacteria bacterium]|nr:exo-alpha-sialidase [Gammaproteobacteria bacterium]